MLTSSVKTKKINNNNNNNYSYLIASIILLSILLLRILYHQPMIPGDESYKNLLLQNNSSFYNLLIKYSSALLGEFLVFISVLLGLLSLYLFNKLLVDNKNFKNYKFYASLLFIINPIFLRVFTTINEFTLIIPAMIFLIHYSVKKTNNNSSKKEDVLTIILSLLLPLIRLGSALIIYSAMLISIAKKEKKKKLLLLILILLGSLIGFLFNSIQIDYLTNGKLFSELGSSIVPSLFMLIIAFLTIISLPNKKPLLGYFFFGITYIYSKDSRIALSLLSVYYSAIFVKYLSERKWFLDSLRKASLLLTYCSFLFIILSTILIQVNSQPTSDLRSLNGLTDTFVVAPKEIMFALKYFTGSQAIIETQNNNQYNDAGTNLVQRLYSTIRDAKAKELLTYIGTNQILITKHQLSTRWQKEDEGLLFLLHNSDNFKKIYEGQTMQLWEYS